MSSILPFSSFIIRTPIYPINTVLEDLDIDKLRILCNNLIIQEAIYLASKPLFLEMMKFCKDSDFKDEKVILSILKYITRLSTRCTPFGLFSGCTIGSLSNVTQLNRSPLNIQRRTTIDNLLLGKLIMKYEVENNNEILYFSNNSKYIVGSQLRYTEYRYVSNSKLHFLSAVENTDLLYSIFSFCSDGRNMSEIIEFVYQRMKDEVTKEDVEDYVSELINNQILVSNLSPIVVGKKNTLEHLIGEIKSGTFRNLLDEMKSTLNKIDVCLNEEEQMYHYLSLEDKIKNYEKTDDNKNYTFQSDILIDFNSATIDYEEYRTNLSDALEILNKLSSDYTVNKMKSFKERFYQRYEDKAVPFALALDTENGIKYIEEKDYDLSSFLDEIKGFVGYNRSYETNKIRLNKAEHFLLKKIFDRDSDVVEIELEDVDGFSENWDNVADTFSIICSMHKDVISLKSVGGNSASCLLGRFGYLDNGIENLIEEIFLKEEQTDKIVAEIVHLPEDRTGNILYRYNTRKFEIPYLGLSSKNPENQILIDDLLIYIENEEVKIRSKKLNKEITPKLSNAHNFSSPQSVPVYRFLCDLQMHKLKADMTLNITTILNLLKYTPRIQYKNIVLSKQNWLLDKEEIIELTKKNNFYNFLETKNIKKNFYLADGDNQLYINISNELSIKMFIQTVKNREHIILKESLYDEFSSKIVDDNECYYANEIILSYYKVKDGGKSAN